MWQNFVSDIHRLVLKSPAVAAGLARLWLATLLTTLR
jgi:hypothetical protein